jgi:hypothetical protein
VLFVIYNNIVLSRVMRKHEREMQLGVLGEHEGVMEKVRRKAHEPALEPSSVV